MIFLEADKELELIFNRLIKTMNVPVEWTGVFVVLEDYLILLGRVRSLLFNFESKKAVTNIVDIPLKEDAVVEIEGNGTLKNTLNMTLYVFGKWGAISGLRVDKQYGQLNELFLGILTEVAVKPEMNENNLRFYKEGIRLNYEDVIQLVMEAKHDEEALDEIAQEEKIGLWHNVCWKKAAYEIQKVELTKEERRQNRIGNHFSLVGYLCPICQSKLFQIVYSAEREQLIDTEEGRVFLARAYTCNQCQSYYAARPQKLFTEGDLYELEYHDDTKAYEDYQELLGIYGDMNFNCRFNEFEADRNRKKQESESEEDQESEEQKSEAQVQELIDKITADIDQMSEQECIALEAQISGKVEEGFFSPQDVNRYEQYAKPKMKQRIRQLEKEKEKKAERKKTYDGKLKVLSRLSDFQIKEMEQRLEEERILEPDEKQVYIDAVKNEKTRRQALHETEQDVKTNQSVPSGQDTQDRKKMPTKQNEKGDQDQRIEENAHADQKKQSEQSVQPVQEIHSEKKVQTAQEKQSERSMQATQEKHSEKKVQPNQEKQSGKGGQPAQEMQLGRRGQTNQEKQSEQSMQLDMDIQSRQNVQVEKHVPVGQNAQTDKSNQMGQRSYAGQSKPMSPDIQSKKIIQTKKNDDRPTEIQKQEIQNYVNRARKINRGDYVNLIEELEKGNYSEEVLNPIKEKLHEKIVQMNQQEIDAIYEEADGDSFAAGYAAYQKLEQGDFLPELKRDALDQLEKRLKKIKTEECELLIKKIRNDWPEELQENPQTHFYPARKVLLEQIEPEEYDCFSQAVNSFAPPRTKFELPIILFDASKKEDGSAGILITEDYLYFSAHFEAFMIPIINIESIEVRKNLFGSALWIVQKDKNTSKLRSLIPKEEYETFAQVLTEFIQYLQEKPESRKIDYLAQAKHEIICCLRCGFKYKEGHVCPKCGYKINL